jgi:predicted ATP-grasp superfamily ATP-dependent carboligase
LPWALFAEGFPIVRIFVQEYCCGGGLLGQDVAASLRLEGWAMLSAILQDLARCPEVTPVALLDPDLIASARALAPSLSAHPSGPDEEVVFRTLVRTCAFAWILAPECDDLLEQRCRWVEEEGVRLLTPPSAAVRLTGDKLEFAEHLRGQGVPTPPTVPLSSASLLPFPLVVKPRQGAGSQATFLVQTPTELRTCPEQARQEGWHGELIAQPWCPGQSVSVAILAGPAGRFALPACTQDLAPPRFHYRGGSLPLPADLDDRARRLALAAAACVPDLAGYFGVDLVLGEQPGDDRVLEINPRWTTSYVGLRALARFGLLEEVLAVVQGQPFRGGAWGSERISFTADGRVAAR